MCVCEGGGDAGGCRARPRPRTPDAYHSPCVGRDGWASLVSRVPLERVPEPLAERRFHASEWGGACMTPWGTGARQPRTARHASNPRPARWREARAHTARLPRCASVVSHPSHVMSCSVGGPVGGAGRGVPRGEARPSTRLRASSPACCHPPSMRGVLAWPVTEPTPLLLRTDGAPDGLCAPGVEQLTGLAGALASFLLGSADLFLCHDVTLRPSVRLLRACLHVPLACLASPWRAWPPVPSVACLRASVTRTLGAEPLLLNYY